MNVESPEKAQGSAPLCQCETGKDKARERQEANPWRVPQRSTEEGRSARSLSTVEAAGGTRDWSKKKESCQKTRFDNVLRKGLKISSSPSTSVDAMDCESFQQ